MVTDTSGIEDLLEAVWEGGGTDLLLTVGSPPLCRIDGDLEPIEGYGELTSDAAEALIVNLLSFEAITEFRQRREIDFAFTWRDLARIRGNAFFQRQTMALALRVVSAATPTLDELCVPDVLEGFANLTHGLVLITGPTGSGKSTTQAALINHINETRKCHIVTIEDPIEYLHTNKLSAVNQREVGTDTESFDRALRAALREDPDVLLIGEMRDPESIQAALTLAETGHLVLATLHTNDTATALDRIVDVFPGSRQSQIRVQLAATLAGVVAQRLVPQIAGGMVAAFEIMVATPAVRNLIRDGKTAQIRNVILTNSKDGMQTLEMDLNDLVARRIVAHEDAINRSIHPKEIREPMAIAPLPAIRRA
jgi:twitching motility protein PilT